MRVNDAVNQYGIYRLTQGGVSTNTWRGEEPGLRHFAWHVGDTDVESLTVEHAADWWHWTDGNLADSTRATRLHQLRSFFTWLIASGYRTTDPTTLLRAPRVQPEIRERLTPDELLSLLDVAKTPRDRCLLALCMNLALRAGELQRLTWRDVNWTDQTIRVRVEKTQEIDDMPISRDLMQELMLWASRIPTDKTRRDALVSAYLIPSQHIAPSGTVTYRWRAQVSEPFEVVKDALRKIGWADVKQEGVHTLRRSVARCYFDMVEAEESFDSATLATMTLLHHTRPDTTLTYIGRDRATLARDRMIKGKPFLSGMRSPAKLRSVS